MTAAWRVFCVAVDAICVPALPVAFWLQVDPGRDAARWVFDAGVTVILVRLALRRLGRDLAALRAPAVRRGRFRFDDVA